MADVNLSIGITGDSSGAVDAAKQAKGALDSLNSVQVGKNVQDGVRKTANTVKELGQTSLSAVNGILPLDSGLKSVAGTALTGFDAIGKLAASGFSPLGLAITGVSLLLPLIINQFKSTEKSAKELLDQIGNVDNLRKTNAELLNTVSILKNYSGASEEARKKISDLEKSERQLEETQKKLNAQFAKTVEKNPAKVFEETNPELEKLIKTAAGITKEMSLVQKHFGTLSHLALAAATAKEKLPGLFEGINQKAPEFVAALGKSSKEIQRLANAGLSTKQIIGTLFQGFDFDHVPQLWNQIYTAINGIVAQGEADILKTEADWAKKSQDNRDRRRQAVIAYYQGLKTLDDIRNQNIVSREQFEQVVIADSEQKIRELGLRGIEAQIARAQAEKTINENRVREAQLQFGALADAERQFAESIQNAYNAIEPPVFDVFGDFAKSIEDANLKMVASKDIAGSLSNDLFALGQAIAYAGNEQLTFANIAEKASKMVIKAVGMEVSKIAIAKGTLMSLEGLGKIAASLWPPNPIGIKSGTGMVAQGAGLIALGGGAAVATGMLSGSAGSGGSDSYSAPEKKDEGQGTVINQTIELSGTYDPGSIELVRRFQNQLAEDLRRQGV